MVQGPLLLIDNPALRVAGHQPALADRELSKVGRYLVHIANNHEDFRNANHSVSPVDHPSIVPVATFRFITSPMKGAHTVSLLSGSILADTSRLSYVSGSISFNLLIEVNKKYVCPNENSYLSLQPLK